MRPTCSVAECLTPSYAKGMCNAHYRRWLLYGDPKIRLKAANKGKICKLEPCTKPARNRGLCAMHYQRWVRYGDPLRVRKAAHGDPERFYRNVVLQYDGTDCLIWPFSKDGNGYGKMWVDDGCRIVSRMVCEDTSGPPPTPDHQAAHSCGKGKLGCVAKDHLSWKTPASNMADKLAHGTHSRGELNPMALIVESAAREILALKGHVKAKEIAARFGVSVDVVYQIHRRRSWKWLTDEIAA